MSNSFSKRAIKACIVSAYNFRSKFFCRRKILISFLFHNLFRDASEIELNETHPIQRLNVDQFRQFVEYFLESDYRFISPNEIANNSLSDQGNVLLTFDDGYFNSLRAIPVLEEYSVPAVFFITAGNVIRRKLFWWDVLYRERSKRGAPEKEIFREERWLLNNRNEVIERHLVKEFGKNAFFELNDLNRPLSVSELKNLSQSHLVTIGNHSCDHVNLPLYSEGEIRSQIETAQTILASITGSRPSIVSYPMGCYDDTVIEISRRIGLTLGITVEPRCDYFPMVSDKQHCMVLGRFGFFGDSRFPSEFDIFRPEVALYFKMHSAAKRVKQRLQNLR